MHFDPKKWFEGLKEIVMRDIQIIYFTIADDEYRKKVNDTITGNDTANRIEGVGGGDVIDVDIIETVKKGDDLRLEYDSRVNFK